MLKQFEQFEMLYKQLFEVSSEVKTLIEEQNYDEVFFKEKYKNQLIEKISIIKNTLELSDEEKDIIEKLKSKILLSDKENLDKIQSLRDETSIALRQEQEKTKITNKYEQIEYEKGSICDYTSD